MAIDVERIVIDALLALVEDEGVPLERVTVKRILDGLAGLSTCGYFPPVVCGGCMLFVLRLM